MRLYATLLAPGAAVAHELQTGRHAWLQVARGKLKVNGQSLEAGDGAAAVDVQRLEIEGIEASEALLFDLA